MAMLLFLAAAVAIAPPQDSGRYEGDWYINDTTDNITGERIVEATRLHLKREDDNFVSLRMQCEDGAPTVFIEWSDTSANRREIIFPDKTVLDVSPVNTSHENPVSQRFILDKVDDIGERGLFASSETSSNLISFIGSSPKAYFTVYLSADSKSSEIEIAGTQRAWDRVSRHCPVKTMPKPPR